MVKELERDINGKYSPQVSPQEMKRSVGELNSEDKEPSSNNEGGSDNICECGKIKEEHWDNIYCDDPLNWVTAFKPKEPPKTTNKMKEQEIPSETNRPEESLSERISEINKLWEELEELVKKMGDAING